MRRRFGFSISEMVDSIRRDIFDWRFNIGKMIEVLGAGWAMLFLVSAVVVGILPAVISGELGKFILAIVGSRGIGVTTVEATKSLGLVGAMITGWFAINSFVNRLEGKMQTTLRYLIEIVMLGTAIIAAGLLGKIIWLIILLILFFGLWTFRSRLWEMVIVILMGAVLFYLVDQDLEMLSRRIIAIDLFGKRFFAIILIWSLVLKKFFGKKNI